MSLFQNQPSYTTTAEQTDEMVKIVTSVSVANIKDSPLKITFQHSHEPLSENHHYSSVPVTNIVNINGIDQGINLEIKEIAQQTRSGVNTTVVFINEKKNDAERFGKTDEKQRCSPHNERHKSRSPSTSDYTLSTSEDSTKKNSICATNSQNYNRLMNSKTRRKKRLFCKGSSSDQFWDVPPPQEFADSTLEGLVSGLVSDLASCSISSLGIADTQPRGFEQVPMNFEKESGNTCYDRVEISPSFDYLSDNSASMTSSSFINRSSLTKDFIIRQKRKSRHNSIAAVEHRECLFPQRRRQTFPLMSTTPKMMQEDLLSYSESFSSGTISPTAQMKSWRIPNLHTRQSLFTPFCMTSSDDSPENVSAVSGLQSNCDDPIEVTDSGFDQELGELEFHNPNASVALTIKVIPPSCSGSEEYMGQSQLALSCEKCENENTLVKATSGCLTDPRYDNRSTERPCKSTLQHVDVPTLLSINESITPKVFDQHANLSLPLKIEKTRNQVDEGAYCLKDGVKTLAPCSLKPEMNAQEHIEKLDQQLMTRSSLEAKDHLKLFSLKDGDSSTNDSWARRRKLFKDSKQRSSAGGSSFTSDITEESVSEDPPSMDLTIRDNENRGFYAETFHSVAWLYQGEKEVPGSSPSSLKARSRVASIRERTVEINKGLGEYPWGFRIQYSKPIVVTEVDTNGAAEEAGLIVGDYVLAVNGTDVTSISHSEAADLARQGPEELTLTVGSDIGRGPNIPRPACRGYLHKRTQSGLIKGWRKRWFVLTHDAWLYYYRHKRDEGKCQALAALKMEGAEVGTDLSLGKPFVLKCHPLSANRVYYLCATSGQEMKRWLEAMERAIHPIIQHHVWEDVTRHNSSLPPLAVKNPECLGLLHKMEKSKDSWVQYYSILKDGCLYLYSGIRATHAYGGIYLQGYMVREQHFGSKKSTIELKPPSDEFKTFYFCAENPNENKRWIVAFKASIKKWLPLRQALQDYMCQPPEATRM
ncbi:uncharacterized protein pdzph1 isoform X2 [Corythoichthys intestinalis]|nr:uncharacterized protein pdzph1 isoform X2 [Corythoichthys intestinalis]